MNHVVRQVETAELLENYRELLQTAEVLPLRISGNSMTPFLVHQRDTVYLSQADCELKVGDIVLYQRDRGAYILHRICSVEDGCCSMVGDAQTVVEHGIRRDQIFAVVRWAVRKGKRQEPGTFWWDFFEKIWIRIIPLRPWICGGYGLICKLIGRRVHD